MSFLQERKGLIKVNRKKNVFCISTPSQMMNAVEFLYENRMSEDDNSVLISSCDQRFIDQTKIIGGSLFSEYVVLFQPRVSLVPPRWYNRIPLKLYRLYHSRKRVDQFFLENEVNGKLVLGNYSNFISQYCTQHHPENIHVLDDGAGTLIMRKKRCIEVASRKPIHDLNDKKSSLPLVKFVMGFADYKIPASLSYFSTYPSDIPDCDSYQENTFGYVTSLYRSKTIDESLVFFVGSPVSESGYISLSDELLLLSRVRKMYEPCKVCYVCHRLDSLEKRNKIRSDFCLVDFEFPIEYAMAKQEVFPKAVVGFFTSAIENFSVISPRNDWVVSYRIPDAMFLNDRMRIRANTVYADFEMNSKVTMISS